MFLRFSRKPQDGSAPIFFSGLTRQHLFITTEPALNSTAPGL